MGQTGRLENHPKWILCSVLSGNSMVGLSAITIAMWEEKKLHLGNKHLLTSNNNNKKINENTKLEGTQRSLSY